MKKLILLFVPLFLIFACFQSSYAKSYYRTYEVAEIRDDGIVLKNADGDYFLIEKDPGTIKVGDIVRYDAVRKVLKKSPWQPAKIIAMNDRTITLQFSSGNKAEINMLSKYRNKFKEGDTVDYNGTNGKMRKSSFTAIENE